MGRRLINANALMEEIDKLPLKNFMGRDVAKAFRNERAILALIDSMPTEEQYNPGHWVEKNGEYFCSECGEPSDS